MQVPFLFRPLPCLACPYIRFNAILGAHLKKYLERFSAFIIEPFNGCGIKVRSAVQANEFPPKLFKFRISY
jgi:hypothetical protein